MPRTPNSAIQPNARKTITYSIRRAILPEISPSNTAKPQIKPCDTIFGTHRPRGPDLHRQATTSLRIRRQPLISINLLFGVEPLVDESPEEGRLAADVDLDRIRRLLHVVLPPGIAA
ncbi:hypothetical protein OIE67_03265 [Nonomuraea fuscirosea]|uniref:hypothetical protein n=1 Tax=Nonomuraea fuscirosea TaxID=1291556 RepID=UPI002DDC1435|nr:hypothetical protein [Nonomuraea fuscirosea]WSA53671.1 hypothetical protein OIE67_03265 [Nonomuraea fuscirosea]